MCGSPVEAVRLLLDSKAAVNKKLPSGATALHFAAQRGRVDVISALRQAGARFRSDSLGGTPLQAFATDDLTDESALAVCKALMAFPDAAEHLNTPSTTGTALDRVACYGFLKTTRFLLDARADVNGSAVTLGIHPLACALSCGKLDVAKLLVRSGACTHPFLDGNANLVPLHVLAEPPSKEALQWCKSIEKPQVSACAKCGLDSSPEGVVRMQKFWQAMLSKWNPPRCSNPKCKGELNTPVMAVSERKERPIGVSLPPRLKKCSRCLKVAYCR